MAELDRIPHMFAPQEPKMLVSVDKKLAELSTLKQNWDSYGACVIKTRALSKVREALKRIISHFNSLSMILPEPDIIPLSTGGVQLEWKNQFGELEVEFHERGDFPLLFTDHRLGLDEELKNASIAVILSFLLKMFGEGEYV